MAKAPGFTQYMTAQPASSSGGYAGTAGAIGTTFSAIASIFDWKDKVKAINAQNIANAEAFKVATQAIRDQLSLAYNRTLTIMTQVKRDRIVTQLAIRKAGVKARGQETVRAAQLNIQGKRAQMDISRDVSREEANMISDTKISSEIEMINTVNQFNDAANAAVANLNNQRPSPVTAPSGMTGLLNTVGAGLNYYNNLSETQKQDTRNVFSFKTFDFGTKTKVDSPVQITNP